MLQSKYLTEDGLQLFLKTIYDKGLNYLYFDKDTGMYTASSEEPEFDDTTFIFCGGCHSTIQGLFAKKIIAELLEFRNYIAIDEHIDCVDWENVPVDTKIIVSHSSSSPDYCRYFAEYKDGKVYTWDCGATSWSSDVKSKNWWEHAKLVK
nr:MAG TPA: hypothetical protein [Caudoviricetes sp.]